MLKTILFLLFPFQLISQSFSPAEIKKWEKQAAQVTIFRDSWGIPHIYGKTDADAVFGLLYAQCEDDFKRVERNYIEKLGRLSELNGEVDLYNDLLIRLLIDTTEAKADYNRASEWLKKLLNAYADGINYYLHTHKHVKPALIKKFYSWYPLLWTDGSIGAINTADVSTTELKAFYTGDTNAVSFAKSEADHLSGSNGFAIAPSKTASGNAILYINPHVTFYFRPEVHMVSEEGLNVYGAVTWGQFFIYQGFNEYCGWMHTSGAVDVADLYEEKISRNNNRLYYEYNRQLKPVKSKTIEIKSRGSSDLKSKIIRAYYTHHGPVMAKRNGKWISLKSNNRSMTSLIQSWQRTKAKGFDEYKKVMDLRANTSNNTVFADNKGNIAYWHGNFIPKRDTSLNWSLPVDGSITATEWKGLHPVNESVHIYNPVNGWIQNCNSTPFTAAGENSPLKNNYPRYMAPDGENFRGINAVRVLKRDSGYTIDKVIAAGYDTYLSAFGILIPALVKRFDQSGKPDSLSEVISILKNWNYYSSDTSIATTIAIEWAQKLNRAIQRVYIDEGEPDQVQLTRKFAATAGNEALLQPLKETIDELKRKFGTWKISWGSINRFQRLTGDLQEKYNDSLPSLPVPYASALWGMLPSYNSRYYPGTQKRYGYGGNSFICAVEFGKKVKAKSLLAGGQSGDPKSPHFKDQAEMYTRGTFKEVLFYKEDVMRGAKRKYKPGKQ